MKSGGRRFFLTLRLGAIVLGLIAGSNAGAASLRGELTYALLLELQSTLPSGRLSRSIIERAAAADASLDVARSTKLPDVSMFCSLPSALTAPVSFHAFVPPSYKYLPVAYQRDFVRSSLVGLTNALNAMSSDPSKSDDAKALALGQYLHFLQDVYLHQDRGKPFETGSVKSMMDQIKASDATSSAAMIPDNMQRAFLATHAVAKAWAQTGKVPPVADTAQFDQSVYTPLSTSQRNDLQRSPEQVSVMKYVEAGVRVLAKSSSIAGAHEAAPEQTHDRLAAALGDVWKAAHPQDAGVFQLPDFSAGSKTSVDFDRHPDLLIPAALRTSDVEVRRAIDDIVLARQAAENVRAEIERLTAVYKAETVVSRQRRIKITLDALREDDSIGMSALSNATSRGSIDKQTSTGTALIALNRGLQDAARLDADLNLRDPEVMAQDFPCPVESVVATAAFEERLNFIIQNISSAAIEAAPGLDEHTGVICRAVVVQAATARFKGGVVQVPKECGVAIKLSFELLNTYARSHLDTRDPIIEDVMARLQRESSRN